MVVTVANVDDEDRAGNSLLQIWELRFVHKAKLLFVLYENVRNSETKSRKINPKVRNGPSFRGLQTGH